jgi:hypothetical protein
VQLDTPVASLVAHGLRSRDLQGTAHRTVRRSGHANSFRRWNSSAVIGMYSRVGAIDTFVGYLCSNMDGHGRYARIIKYAVTLGHPWPPPLALIAVERRLGYRHRCGEFTVSWSTPMAGHKRLILSHTQATGPLTSGLLEQYLRPFGRTTQ